MKMLATRYLEVGGGYGLALWFWRRPLVGLAFGRGGYFNIRLPESVISLKHKRDALFTERERVVPTFWFGPFLLSWRPVPRF